MRIAITTATDAGYLPAACCQISSVWEQKGDADVELFLVVCDVAAAEIEAASSFFDRRGIVATIIDAGKIAADIKPINTRWPKAAYLRLYFDKIFGPEYSRLIYFDADTRIRTPLEPLFSVDLGGKPVGAVHDFIYYLTGNIRRRRKELMLAEDAPYLQSGVMVFDWPATLATDALKGARRFLEVHPERCQEAPDQDALNAQFEDLWAPIDPRWNLHETYLSFGGRQTPFLEHYTSTKPWSKRRPVRWKGAADWYRDQLRGTPWSDFIPEQHPLDRLNVEIEDFRFRFSPRARNILAARAPWLLAIAGIEQHRSDTSPLPWAPRNAEDVEVMADALIQEAAGLRPPIRPPESVLRGYGTGLPIGLA